jgi:hypothetical protein
VWAQEEWLTQHAGKMDQEAADEMETEAKRNLKAASKSYQEEEAGVSQSGDVACR